MAVWALARVSKTTVFPTNFQRVFREFSSYVPPPVGPTSILVCLVFIVSYNCTRHIYNVIYIETYLHDLIHLVRHHLVVMLF